MMQVKFYRLYKLAGQWTVLKLKVIWNKFLLNQFCVFFTYQACNARDVETFKISLMQFDTKLYGEDACLST